MKLYNFPNKEIRALAIKDYMKRHDIKKAVCFSCGNASRALKQIGVDVLDISPTGDFTANRWFTQAEIASTFPDYLDVTSGHLPMEAMVIVSEYFKWFLDELPEEINLPTGSGETLVELKLAFPKTKITAVYDLNKATEFSPQAPMNGLVEILAERIIKKKGEAYGG